MHQKQEQFEQARLFSKKLEIPDWVAFLCVIPSWSDFIGI
jgi:hypothetical protein